MTNHIIIEGDNIARFQILRLVKALELETRTGMRFSGGSVLKAAQQQYGIKARTKAAAIEELKELLEAS